MSTQVLDRPATHVRPTAPRGDAPVTGWRRALRDGFVVGRATAIGHVLGVATSLLLRMLLSPAQMGVWQTVKLLLGYNDCADLGISRGAVREYTIARGRGDTRDARRDLHLALTVNTLGSVTYGGIVAGVGAWIGLGAGGDSAFAWAIGLVTAGILIVLTRRVTYHVTILRARQDFNVTSNLSILEAMLTLALAGLATYLWGFAGLCVGTIGVVLATLVYVLPRRGETLAWAWNPARIGRLVAIGGPILLADTVSTLFRSLDKIMILAYLTQGEHQLGCYSLALLVTTQLSGLGSMFSLVMNPRYGELYGAAGSQRHVARLAARASEILAAMMALPAGLALVAGPPILAWLLPDYQAGLAPLAWLVPGTLVLCATMPASQYLVAVNRQWRALVAVSLATGFGALANHVVLVGGLGLAGVAMATCLAYVVYLVFLVGVSLWTELDRRGRVRYLGMLTLTTGPTLATALRLMPPEDASTSSWYLVALASGLVALVWIASAAAAWRFGGWHKDFQRARRRSSCEITDVDSNV